MADVAVKYGLLSATGFNFKDPSLMLPYTSAGLGIGAVSGGAVQTHDTVAFWTALSSYGVIDSTSWSANTYKTIYSHTGKGLIYAMIACTAGGAETSTFEVTIDGVLKELTITNASTERAMLTVSALSNVADFTTSSAQIFTTDNGLDAGTLTTLQTLAAMRMLPLRWHGVVGVPALQYDVSCLIRMKHSAIITNSTATAYSGVMVRKRIAA